MALLFAGALVALPLLLLKSGQAGASHAQAEASSPVVVVVSSTNGSSRPSTATPSTMPQWQLLRYRGKAPTQGSPVATTTPPPAASTTTTTTVPKPVVHRTTTTVPPTTTTTATTAPVPPTSYPPTVAVVAQSATGGATWYGEAAPGTCASPWLPFGTELHVVNDATGATTQCVVDDREAQNPGRVVDLSIPGFEQIAPLYSGVATVTITW
jgi:rare lipoprotein A (peptidoglycan hydrolase)